MKAADLKRAIELSEAIENATLLLKALRARKSFRIFGVYHGDGGAEFDGTFSDAAGDTIIAYLNGKLEHMRADLEALGVTA